MTAQRPRSAGARIAVATVVAALAGALAPPPGGAQGTGPYDWSLGTYGGRQFKRVVISGARCGNGTEFPIFWSSGPRQVAGKLNRRVVLWLPGGGSTLIERDGTLSSPISSLAEVRNRLNAPVTAGARRMLFFQHASNDVHVGKAHWVVLPYCTQDFHSGRRTQPRTYDFTGVRSLVRDVEARVRGGTTPAALERAYPGMDVEGGPGAGGFTVTRLTITIEQRGALNVEAALPAITFALAFEGVDLARADVTIAGSSAGGFGSWYNARLFGDRLYPHRADTDAGGARLARLTIVPMSGSPAERVWSDAANGLVTSPDQVASLDHRLDHHSVARPCSLAGGAYTPTPGAHCDDTLDLIRHYLRRWAGLDLRIAPVINKEDPLGLRGFAGQPGQPGYAAGLVRFCKTVHRLSQEAARTGSQVHPWTAWMWDNKPTPSSPLVIGQVHGFEFATGLVPQLDPEEPGTWHPSLLEWVNAVAARDPRLASTRSQIERRSGLVRNAFDPGTTMMPFDPPDGISPYQRAACNVPPPGS